MQEMLNLMLDQKKGNGFPMEKSFDTPYEHLFHSYETRILFTEVCTETIQQKTPNMTNMHYIFASLFNGLFIIAPIVTVLFLSLFFFFLVAMLSY